MQIPAQGDEPVFCLTYGCDVRRLDDGRMVPRTAVAERIAAVAGAGGVVVVAAEAGTGKHVLAQQALEQLAGVDVAIHDADRCDADGLVALGRTLATRVAGTGAIVVARHDPGLCLHELGETGPVLELDGQDLAWSEAEVAEGLERWGLRGDAEHLVTVTEGWCAAVRLGAFVGEHALAPASEPLADYLFADALRGVPPEHRDAILRLSFVEAFDAADVASIVGAGIDGEQTLAALSRWRLFLRPAGSAGAGGADIWRVHRLVAAVARRRLMLEDPAAARALRARGSVGAVDPSAAVDAAVTDSALAAHAWELLLDGRLARPSPAALELAQTGAAPARLAAALGLLAVGDARLGAPLLAPRVASDEPSRRDPVRRLAQLMVARLDGDRTAVDQRSQALDRLPDVDVGLQAMAAIERGLLAHDLGKFVDAERQLAIGAGLAGHAARPAVLARAQGALALCCIAFSRLHESTRHAEAALAEPAAGLPDGRVRAMLALTLCAYLRDDLTTAGELMLQTRQLATQIRDDSLWGLVLLYDAIVAEALGDYDRARFTLAEARATAGHPVARVRWPLLDFVGVRLLDHVGRSDEAARLAAALPRTLETDLAHARGLLAEQRPRDAMALLAPWTADAGPDSPLAGRISWHLVTFALAAAAAQDDEAAHSAIERALDLAAPELVRRPFVEERVRLRPLLERHGAGATKHGAFVRDLLERHRPVEHAATSDAQLREPLTERERMVLGYLPSTMTAAEIAAALTVSEATVRTHLRHIYDKLGAHGRRDAVARARVLGLVAQDGSESRDRWIPGT
jgi:LuxR family maltose regulon positive regulatory protein